MRLELTLIKGVIQDTLQRCHEESVSMTASALAYKTILSFIPFLAVSLALFKSFGGMEKIYGLIEPVIIQNLAADSGEHVSTMIRQYIINIRVGTLGVTGMIALIFTSVSMLANAEKAFNDIWKCKNQKSWLQRLAFYWMIITLGPVALSVAVSALGATENMMPIIFVSKIKLGTFFPLLLFYVAYKWVPTRFVHWKAALIPALFTGLNFGLAKILYALYTTRVVSYNKVYGSIGAIPIILLWIYILWLIILTGVALSTSIQTRIEAKS